MKSFFNVIALAGRIQTAASKAAVKTIVDSRVVADIRDTYIEISEAFKASELPAAVQEYRDYQREQAHLLNQWAADHAEEFAEVRAAAAVLKAQLRSLVSEPEPASEDRPVLVLVPDGIEGEGAN